MAPIPAAVFKDNEQADSKYKSVFEQIIRTTTGVYS